MIRKAFRMTVNVGKEAEYARRHQPICDIMPANEDDSPLSTDLREVFHLD